MGMYTQFRGEWKLKPDLEDKVVQALSWITKVKPRQHESYFSYPHASELFDDSGFWQSWRHSNLGLNFNASKNFENKWTATPLDVEGQSFNEFYLNDKEGYYHLVVSCDCKNYDRQIQKFINWVHQFELNKEDKQIGVLYYEEHTHRTLVYNKESV